MQKRLLILFAVCVPLAFKGLAQNTVSETNTWFFLLSKIKFSDLLGANLEVQDRLGGFLRHQGKFILRPSFNFKANDYLELATGYTFIRYRPYEPYPLTGTRNENNLWEQASFKHKLGSVSVQYRIRQEHRWVQQISAIDHSTVVGVKFNNTVRLRVALKHDVVHLSNDRKIFLLAFDELRLGQGVDLLPDKASKNWWYFGAGFKYNERSVLRLGYLHQSDYTSDGTITSPVIWTMYTYKLDIRKKNSTNR